MNRFLKYYIRRYYETALKVDYFVGGHPHGFARILLAISPLACGHQVAFVLYLTIKSGPPNAATDRFCTESSSCFCTSVLFS